MNQKKCHICNLLKDINEFGKDKGRHDGHYIYCRPCARERSRKAYENRRRSGRLGGRREYDRKYRITNREVLKIDRRHKHRSYMWRTRLNAVNAYGGRCACCGEDNPHFLQVDHINGGGNKDRKLFGRFGSRFYIWLKRQGYPKDKYRVLCANCNTAVGFFGFCPHQGVGRQIDMFDQTKDWFHERATGTCDPLGRTPLRSSHHGRKAK